jgi:predicted ATPase/class 3 adenylate cyclase
MAQLPTGTVTFLFSDIAGSTQTLQRLGAEGYARVLAESQSILRAIWVAHGGGEVDTAGDGFFVAFPSAPQAVAAAAEAVRALAEYSWPEGGVIQVRIGLHTGAPQLVGDHYVGLDVHRAARIAAAGHGGQVLLSEATRGLVEQDLPAGVSLRDLGPQRLKDLQHAERVYQLILPGLPSEFPALKTLDHHAHNLPIQPTALLGREGPVAAICSLLRRADVRLVTLTGPGGIGKTRLAIQVAAELVDDFPDGVWFVRLSRLVDPDLVLPTVAQTLGLKEQGAQPIAETLRAHLASKRMLLALDNFEHVVEAASEVADLLAASPGLTVLVTSRVPLHLRGEREYPLSPLPAPPPGQVSPERLSQYAAVALFVERAAEVRPDFTVTLANASAIAEICARLDGLPLAIELAAARIRLLPPEALLGQLSARLHLLTGGARDLEERQRTMRATIAWSEDLLAPEERVLFRRLAVFAGGCTLAEAEQVCLAPESATALNFQMLDGLGALVEQSLVQPREEGGEPRFGLLHVIREYALERLEASGEAETLRRAHATYFVALTEQAEPEFLGPQAATWYDRLDREHDNLRAALGWAREQGEVELGLRLAAAAWRFWFVRGYFGEGRAWLEGLLTAAANSQAEHAAPAEARARALTAIGTLAEWQGDYGPATRWLEQGVSDAREEGDLRTLALALNSLGAVAAHQLEIETATACYVESVEVARQAGDQWGVVRAQSNLGFMAYFRGDMEAAAKYLEEPIAYSREVGSYEGLGVELALAGAIARRQGDLTHALAFQREALSLHWEMRNLHRVAETLQMLASSAGAGEQGEVAARLLGAAATLRKTIGVPQPVFWRRDTEEAVAPARAALGEERWTKAFAAGQALSLEEAIAEALAGEGGGADG